MRKESVSLVVFFTLVINSVCVVAQTALEPEAQDAEISKQSNSSNVLEEVIVTARRTEESLQDVPVSVTALSNDDLKRESIGSAQDLQGKVPSLVIGSVGIMRNTQSPTIRGMGANFTGSPGVIMYFAEVPLPADSFSNAQGGPGMFFDLRNMQVLKGPQGTLFGRNTTGGAIILDPAKPADTFSASVQTEKGNYGLDVLEGVLNLPLVEDSLLLRVSAKKFHRDGFTIDVNTGLDMDNKQWEQIRWGLLWRPSDTVENYLLAYRSLTDENGTGNILDDINIDAIGKLAPGIVPVLGDVIDALGLSDDIGCITYAALFEADLSTFASGIATLPSAVANTQCGADLVANQKARGIRKTERSVQPFNKSNIRSVINTTSWQFSDAYEFRNILSYSRYVRSFNWDQDGSVLPMVDTVTDVGSSNTSTITEEAQIQGNAFDEQLKFVVGYYWERFRPEGAQENHGRAFGGLKFIVQTYLTERDSYGPYVQGTYNLGALDSRLDGLSYTLGVRRSTDDIYGEASGIIGSGYVLTGGIKTTATTWTTGLDYQRDWGLLYGKISRGYKNGGFSPVSVNPDTFTYKPEYLTSYEVGFKSDFSIVEMPVRLNMAAYYSDYTDIQRTGTDLVPTDGFPDIGVATYNAGEAWVSGVETELTMQPISDLRLIVNYSYTDAAYEEYKLQHAGILPKLDCNGNYIDKGPVDLSCLPFQSVPQHQYSVTARYSLPIPEEFGGVEFSVTYSWVDESYVTATTLPSDEPGAWIDDFDLINASLYWRQIYTSNFDLQLFATNLEDKEYRIGNSNTWREVYARNSIWGEPRMYGLRLSYRWGE